MNTLLEIGLLLIIGYVAGWLLHQINLPRIIGYIATGILFSPDTFPFISPEFLRDTEPLMEVCMAFIAFEVGGALKWSRIKKHEKEIIYITLLASLFPFILITLGICFMGILFPGLFPFGSLILLLLALQLGALASPTEPATTLAIMHQFKAKGKVTDSMLGVVSLDDTLGIILFSIVISIEAFFTGSRSGVITNAILNSIFQVVASILLGGGMAFLMEFVSRIVKRKEEGQWIVIIASLIILCIGISKLIHIDELLSSMAMGIIIVNKSVHEAKIFKLIERYTEDLVFLFFFLLSGLHLNIATLPHAAPLILLFVLLRMVGKYLGASIGARFAKADRAIRKFTAGGLVPQGGIVIGLVLSVYQNEAFKDISEILLTTVMGATIINELIGPVMAKQALKKAGELKNSENKK